MQANRLIKATGRRIDKIARIINDTAKINTILQIDVENNIMKAWGKRKVLQAGDMIEIAGLNIKAMIVGVSDHKIIYEINKEIKHFDLRHFKKMITKFDLSFISIPAMGITA